MTYHRAAAAATQPTAQNLFCTEVLLLRLYECSRTQLAVPAHPLYAREEPLQGSRFHVAQFTGRPTSTKARELHMYEFNLTRVTEGPGGSPPKGPRVVQLDQSPPLSTNPSLASVTASDRDGASSRKCLGRQHNTLEQAWVRGKANSSSKVRRYQREGTGN